MHKMKFIHRFQNQERGMHLHSIFSVFLRQGNCGANKQNPIFFTLKKDKSGNLFAKVVLMDNKKVRQIYNPHIYSFFLILSCKIFIIHLLIWLTRKKKKWFLQIIGLRKGHSTANKSDWKLECEITFQTNFFI